MEGEKNPTNKWQDGFSSLLQFCAFNTGEILVISFFFCRWEGILPPPQVLSLQRVLPELPPRGGKMLWLRLCRPASAGVSHA